MRNYNKTESHFVNICYGLLILFGLIGAVMHKGGEMPLLILMLVPTVWVNSMLLGKMSSSISTLMSKKSNDSKEDSTIDKE